MKNKEIVDLFFENETGKIFLTETRKLITIAKCHGGVETKKISEKQKNL